MVKKSDLIFAPTSLKKNAIFSLAVALPPSEKHPGYAHAYMLWCVACSKLTVINMGAGSLGQEGAAAPSWNLIMKISYAVLQYNIQYFSLFSGFTPSWKIFWRRPWLLMLSCFRLLKY